MALLAQTSVDSVANLRWRRGSLTRKTAGLVLSAQGHRVTLLADESPPSDQPLVLDASGDAPTESVMGGLVSRAEIGHSGLTLVELELLRQAPVWLTGAAAFSNAAS
jgi:hypothetical protein